jgi:hypothetical protein
MKYHHADIFFLLAKISWIDRLSGAPLACHKEERFGIYRWLVSHMEFGKNRAKRGRISTLNVCRATPA